MSKQVYTTPKRQNGFSYIAFLLVVSVSIFVGLFAIKVGPEYFENMTVVKIVDDLNQKPELLSKSRREVYATLDKMYRLNSLWSLKTRDTIVLTRVGPVYKVAIKYEKRTNLFGNIDLVTSFDTTGQADASGKKVAQASGT